MAPYWLRYGFVYGLIGFSIGTIAAALRAFFITTENFYTVLAIEFILSIAFICAYGLFLMKKASHWTTISALYYGFFGAFVYVFVGINLNLLLLDGNIFDLISTISFTHGHHYLILIVIMSMTPVLATQRA